MASTPKMGILLGVLTIIMIIVIIVYVVILSSYNKLINNESKYCLSSTCVYFSDQCNNTPFKVVDGKLVCADPSIFSGSFTGVSNPP